MTTIELDPQDVTILRSALHSFLDDFGHDERDVIDRIKALLAKLPEETPSPAA
jgi:hypothetical protein